LTVCSLLLVGCTDDTTSPDAQLRAAIDALVTAAQAGSAQQVATGLAPDYLDARHPDKRSAVATLHWYLRRHRSINLFTLVRDLQLNEPNMTARSIVMVAMAGVPIASRESLLSINADLYRFEVDWRYQDDRWLVTTSHWQRANISDF
jgi:hypothetical protein